MKKILLASGCSFTDDNFVSAVHPEMICDWPKWPELLAKKLDMNCINLGQNGAGNEYIYSSLLEKILKIKDKSTIGLVIPAWSQCQRKDYQEGPYSIWKQRRINQDGDIFSFLRKDLRYMISLQLICERFNIPLKQFQMISLFDGFISGLSKTDAEKHENKDNPEFVKKYEYIPVSESQSVDRTTCDKIVLKYDKYINEKDFIGWPLSKRIGGFHVEEKTLRYKPGLSLTYRTDLLVSELDVHPNGKGHQLITEFLYDRLG